MKLLAVPVVALIAFGCGSAGGGTASSGLKGRVMRGPITPVCRANKPCSAPAPGVKLSFARNGQVAATATTNAKGWYRVSLPPNRYSVHTKSRGLGSGPTPSSVAVPSGRFKRVDFQLDTGIR